MIMKTNYMSARWGAPAGEKDIEVLEGVGHWHCIEAPEPIAVRISEFLKLLTR